MPGYFVLGMVYAFAAAVQPGPFQAYLISQSLANGWRHTIFAACAPLISDMPIIAVVLFVISRVPPQLIQVLQCAGGLFLLYLAYAAFRAWRSYDVWGKPSLRSSRESVFKAAMVNLLNPNPYLGWSLVMGPIFLKGWRETPANGIALLAGFYGTLIVSSAGIIILFAAAKNLGPRVNRKLICISAIALACFGVYQLWLGGAATWWK